MDNVKDKIAKLLAMANDGRGNEFEAEAALRQAEALMRKHGIEAGELMDCIGQKPIYKWVSVSVPVRVPKPAAEWPRWFGFMCFGIAVFTDTKISSYHDGQYGICGKFQGEETDVEYAVWLAKRLRDDIRAQSAAFMGSRRERELFRKGMASRLQGRMKQLRKERNAEYQAAGTGTALVVVTTKIALRDEEFGKQQTRRHPTNVFNRDAYGAGRAAGDRASLNRPIGGGSALRIGK